jgi:hypothetical protein
MDAKSCAFSFIIFIHGQIKHEYKLEINLTHCKRKKPYCMTTDKKSK